MPATTEEIAAIEHVLGARPARDLHDSIGGHINRERRHLLLPTLQREQGKTLVIATHQLDEAEQLCDHVCVLHQGALLSCEPKTAALSRAIDLADYLQATIAGASVTPQRCSAELSGSRSTP